MIATPLGDANRAIRSARRRFALGRVERWRVINPIRVIDEMLDELEHLNLRGARRVPIVWEPRLALLAAHLPTPVRVDPAELRAGISPNRLIEALFTLQDQLLDLKVGPLRRWLREEEEEPVDARDRDDDEAPGLPPAA
ncbi:MAG: hypothetical protein M3170_03550 [Candidatus Dormibacteraeota bacterium]|nr:hypothetical protein [Candidatus Dormibacteraeota bacterium]